MKLQPDKCDFPRKEICHVTGHTRVRPDEKRPEAVKDFPEPKNPTAKHFLRFTCIIQRFIQNFSKIAKPQTELLKKDTLCLE
jgi:hypothetical protein